MNCRPLPVVVALAILVGGIVLVGCGKLGGGGDGEGLPIPPPTGGGGGPPEPPFLRAPGKAPLGIRHLGRLIQARADHR